MSNWHLTQALTALHAARRSLLETDPDLVADETLLSESLASEQADVEAEIRRTISDATHAAAMAAQADEAAKNLIARRGRYRNRAAVLRSAVFAAMDAIGSRRLEWPEATVTIMQPRPGVVITDPNALPDDLVVIERKPLVAAIQSALKQGRDVPGAEMQNGMPTLQVRTK